MAGKVAQLAPVNAATLAAALGITERSVQQMTVSGEIEAVSGGGGKGSTRKYDLLASTSGYIASLKAKAAERASAPLEERKLRADTDYREAKAAQEQLRLAELEGRMHSSEDVAAATEQLVYAVRSALVAMPGRLAVDVAATGNADEASRLIRSEVERVLTDLMEFEYDPQFYAARARGRRGLEAADGQGA